MTDHRVPDDRVPQEQTRWAALTGSTSGADYQARFDALARTGMDLHGEAHLCAGLVEAPARILDAGCGTGRVAIRLAELGYSYVGVDADDSMLAVARGTAGVDWRRVDLAAGPLPDAVELAIAAGNVIALLAPGTLVASVGNLAAALVSGGLLVTGFGLDAAHLPPGCPLTGLAEFDAACAGAGLALRQRYATWDRAPFDDGGYVVSVHRAG